MGAKCDFHFRNPCAKPWIPCRLLMIVLPFLPESAFRCEDAFSPKPKIDSSVIKLTPRVSQRVQVESVKTFFSVVNTSFLHKRKILKNNLIGWKSLYQKRNDKTELAGINLNRRAETLSIEEFAILSNYINSNGDRI